MHFLKRIIENYHINKNIKIKIDKLFEELSQISKVSDKLIITGKPTGNSWRGIYNGAIAFLPNATFAIPQYYSTPIYTKTEYYKLCEKILDLNFKTIIFSGYIQYFKQLILTLNTLQKKLNKSADIYLIYHSSFASNSEDDYTNNLLKEILQLNIDGYIKKIGFVKKGMAETFSRVSDIDAHYIIPQTKKIKKLGKHPNIDTSQLNLGILTHNQYRKNLHNQVAAALMFNNAEIHIRKNYDFDYLSSNDRLVIHDFFDDYDDFLRLSGSMDINFYVSFSECYGLVITESLSMGVPCLASYNSGMFDYNDELRDLLIVKDYDNSNSIYEQAQIALDNKEKIKKLGPLYVDELNNISKEKFEKFVK